MGSEGNNRMSVNEAMPEGQTFGYLILNGGGKLSLSEPDPSVMTINVIANALSHLCRFSGQVSDFY